MQVKTQGVIEVYNISSLGHQEDLLWQPAGVTILIPLTAKFELLSGLITGGWVMYHTRLQHLGDLS